MEVKCHQHRLKDEKNSTYGSSPCLATYPPASVVISMPLPNFPNYLPSKASPISDLSPVTLSACLLQRLHFKRTQNHTPRLCSSPRLLFPTSHVGSTPQTETPERVPPHTRLLPLTHCLCCCYECDSSIDLLDLNAQRAATGIHYLCMPCQGKKIHPHFLSDRTEGSGRGPDCIPAPAGTSSSPCLLLLWVAK